MKHATPLDELEHWMQLLQLELYRHAERRYLLAIARLCEVFADKVSRDKYAPPAQLSRRMKLSVAWLDLKRQVDGNAPVKRPPRLRVIHGGRG